MREGRERPAECIDRNLTALSPGVREAHVGTQLGASFELLRRFAQPTAVVHETIREQVHG
jgi:hypothetical protein